MTRRDFAAFAAAPAVGAQPAAQIDPALIRRHDESVERLLRMQIADVKDPNCGGYADAFGFFSASTGGAILDTYVAALVCPASRFYKSNEVMQRAGLAAGYLRRKQHDDGTIDLYITNFHSTPDLAFTIHNVASAALLAKLNNLTALFGEMEPFLRKAGDALVRGGVHTPNHRWVTCEALSQMNEVMPDARFVRRAEQWLAEGIDIDADGQFNERSTTVYNTVSDKALLVTALKLGKPELLDPVRRNLEAMMYLVHPNGEVVTEISRRQDQYERAGMERYWLPLRYLAIKDSNGRFAEMARRVEPRGAWLSAYLRFPELAQPLPASAPLPEDYHKLMPAVEIARIRRGQMSASVLLNGNSRFFAMRNGECVVQAVRFASAFFGKGQFRPAKWERTADGYRMTQSMEGPYYQPLDPPRKVEASDWDKVRGLRPRSEVQKMEYRVEVKEAKGRRGGFTIEIAAEGTAGVPLAVEVNLREGVQVEGAAPAPGAQNASILKSGYAVARSGKDTIRFGPGFAEHSYTQVRGAEPRLPGESVYLCGFTPLRRVLEFDAPA
ncbi:MAG: terpene cyclase/mutase family protein [Acidobacteria bacterium]|nr:terpene cyclase/mutase family protein [Acidobacteriota bacterium]